MKNGIHIQFLVDIPKQPHTTKQRKQIFYNIPYYPFQFSRFKNLLYFCRLQR
nr:MAG TPA: hypothetical protein [Caudoviricetes sp.]